MARPTKKPTQDSDPAASTGTRRSLRNSPQGAVALAISPPIEQSEAMDVDFDDATANITSANTTSETRPIISSKNPIVFSKNPIVIEAEQGDADMADDNIPTIPSLASTGQVQHTTQDPAQKSAAGELLQRGTTTTTQKPDINKPYGHKAAVRGEYEGLTLWVCTSCNDGLTWIENRLTETPTLHPAHNSRSKDTSEPHARIMVCYAGWSTNGRRIGRSNKFATGHMAAYFSAKSTFNKMSVVIPDKRDDLLYDNWGLKRPPKKNGDPADKVYYTWPIDAYTLALDSLLLMLRQLSREVVEYRKKRLMAWYPQQVKENGEHKDLSCRVVLYMRNDTVFGDLKNLPDRVIPKDQMVPEYSPVLRAIQTELALLSKDGIILEPRVISRDDSREAWDFTNGRKVNCD